MIRIFIRVDDQNPGHTRISVFIDHAFCGQLTLKTSEWEILDAALTRGTHNGITLEVER